MAIFEAADLEAIALDAETIDECLALLKSCPPALPDQTPSVPSRRAGLWRKAIAQDKRGVILRRLGEEGWELEHFFDRLAQLPERAADDAWLDRFRAYADALASPGPAAIVAEEVAARETAFSDVMAPLAQYACDGIDHELALAALGPAGMGPGMAGFAKLLLNRLCWYLGPGLYTDFSVYRGKQAPKEVATGPDCDDRIYRAFLDRLHAGGLREFFLSRPVLARALTTIVDNWRAGMSSFLRHLAEDRPHLEAFVGARGLGDVTAVEAGLSDPHNGGRTVIKVTFAGGRDLVYKPRPLTLECKWKRLLSRLESQGAPFLPRAIPSLERGRHGWQIFCTGREARNKEELQDFFHSAGASLALFRLLGTTDIHEENLIADGDAPVFIDLETLVSSDHRDRLPMHMANDIAVRELENSVYRSLLLPRAIKEPGGESRVLGGLQPNVPQNVPVWTFIDPNTDRMRFAKKLVPSSVNNNLPLHKGDVALPTRYRPTVVAGYQAMTEFFVQRRAALGKPDGPMVQLGASQARILCRPTSTYAALMNLLRDPRSQMSGVAWSARLEISYRQAPPRGLLSDPRLLVAERKAMLELDIPYFWCASGGEALCDRTGTLIPGAFDPIPQTIKKRVAAFGEADVARDRSIINLHLTDIAETERMSAFEAWRTQEPDSLPQAAILDEVQRLKNIIAGNATWIADGAAWWGKRKSGEAGYDMNLLGYGLYDGAVGIALFLSALDKVTGTKSEAGRLAAAALAPLELTSRLDDGAMWPLLPDSIGELGLTIYGLVLIADFLDDDRWLDVAGRLAQRITPERIAKGASFDLLDGTSGAIVGLLKLAERRPGTVWLARATEAGEHLLSAHGDGAGPHPWWPNRDRLVFAGLAHGLAGVKLALSRLARKSGRADFGAMAEEIQSRINEAYDPKLDDWHRLVEGSEAAAADNPEAGYNARWCHGLVEIGLMELARGGGQRGVSGATHRHQRCFDFLCCGNFGTIDFLLRAAGVGDPALADLARRLASQRIEWARANGGYLLEFGGDGTDVSFFRGISGIGYTLLRTLAPGRLPCVLSFE